MRNKILIMDMITGMPIDSINFLTVTVSIFSTDFCSILSPFTQKSALPDTSRIYAHRQHAVCEYKNKRGTKSWIYAFCYTLVIF